MLIYRNVQQELFPQMIQNPVILNQQLNLKILLQM